jgi:hypothetical protein
MDAHFPHEHAIFLRFLDCAQEFRVRGDSIRRGEGYDLSCSSETGEALAFELTEVTDQNWAAVLAGIIGTACLLNERLKNGTDADTLAVRARYWEHDIAVWLAPGTRTRDLRPLIDPLFAWLAASDPAAVSTMQTPEALRPTVQRVEPRHFPGIKGLCFHVPASALTWIGDTSVPTTRAKFEKDYPPGIGLQLLVYFRRQPAWPDAAAKIRAYLEVEMPHEAFSTVWVYDDQSRQLLLRYP